MNTYIAGTTKTCSTCLDFQENQPKDKTVLHEIHERPWESVGADILSVINKNYLSILDNYGKFLVIK